MIGVLARDAEYDVIREFFELFKTPWAFYRDDLQCDVLICSQTRPETSSAKLILVYGAEQKTFDRENGIEILSQRQGGVISYKKDRIPIYGSLLAFRGLKNRTLLDDETGNTAAYELDSSRKRIARIGFDLFYEIRHLLTRGQPLAHARIPTLELHIAVLRDLIIGSAITLVEIPPIPAASKFTACLTHDVDHAAVRTHKCDHAVCGFLYRATLGSLISFCKGRRTVRQLAANWMAAFSLPFVHLGLARDFWNQFDRYLDLEKDRKSTFFVIPKKGEPGQAADGPAPKKRATCYEAGQIQDKLDRLRSAGREIAVHGIDAWRDSESGRAELEVIRQLGGDSHIGVRMHWLFFDERSPAKLENAGFSYDSTIGYNQTVGYRAGTTQAFKPLDVDRMLELPMHVMDTAMFFPSYMNLSPKQASNVIGEFVTNAVRFGGTLTVNWHDRSIAPERFWDETYVQLLQDLQSEGAWFATAAEAVSWFRKRRSVQINSVTADDKTIRVKVRLDETMVDRLPGLRLRIYGAKPARTLFAESSTETKFVEMNFSRSEELEFAC